MGVIIKKDEITGQDIEIFQGSPEVIWESIIGLLDNKYTMSWIVTDKKSYSFEDIETFGARQTLLAIFWTGFKEMSIGYFNFDTKKTVYKNYEVLDKNI